MCSQSGLGNKFHPHCPGQYVGVRGADRGAVRETVNTLLPPSDWIPAIAPSVLFPLLTRPADIFVYPAYISAHAQKRPALHSVCLQGDMMVVGQSRGGVLTVVDVATLRFMEVVKVRFQVFS